MPADSQGLGLVQEVQWVGLIDGSLFVNLLEVITRKLSHNMVPNESYIRNNNHYFCSASS